MLATNIACILSIFIFIIHLLLNFEMYYKNVKGKLNYKAIYTEAGFNTYYVNINPIIKMELKSSFENISLYTSLNYDKELKWLFNLKYNIF